MPAPAAASGADTRPSETPKDLKKRVRGLDKSLTSVHERLVQTERQIFDLERSYLEETRLYGNVLQGWDAYLDTKGKGNKGKGKGGAGRGAKREASEDGEEGMYRHVLLLLCSPWSQSEREGERRVGPRGQ